MISMVVCAQEERMVVQMQDGSEVEYLVSDVNKVYFNAQTPGAATGEAVDLGLSVKWASCNVGATSPEDYGGYYAWGETEEKESYTKDTYAYYDAETGEYTGMGDDIAGTDHDVAHVKWGGNWRMPSKDEIQELVSDCTWTAATQNGVAGYTVTGSNGNSIFLPLAGYRYGTNKNSMGSYGRYWSSTANEYYTSSTYYAYFYSGGINIGSSPRYYGQVVRPVAE